MSVTFVTFTSQIPSESTPPSGLNRVVEYFTSEANQSNTRTADVSSANTSSIRRSKRSRHSRRATNEVEQTGNETEEPVVEFDVGGVDQYDEDVAAVRASKNERMLKNIESTLDGTYWSVSGCRIRRKSDIFVPSW